MVIRSKDQAGPEEIDQIKREARQGSLIEWLSCYIGRLQHNKETFTCYRECDGFLDLVRNSRCIMHPSSNEFS